MSNNLAATELGDGFMKDQNIALKSLARRRHMQGFSFSLEDPLKFIEVSAGLEKGANDPMDCFFPSMNVMDDLFSKLAMSLRAAHQSQVDTLLACTAMRLALNPLTTG